MTMTETEVIELAMKLIKAESEESVERILKEYSLWDDSNWKYFGGEENNYATIGNQQNDSIAAIIEKILNASDAILTKECLKNGIDPKDECNAPKSIKEALEKFFGISGGDVSSLSAEEATAFASENILITATSEDQELKTYKPCISIIDNGEGQCPDKIEDTFLSLGKTNKLSIPFVQGKFNMGGTGVLQFCGSKKFQLILTKRNSCISEKESDEYKDYWGLTIIRKQSPKEGQRSSAYTYLAPEGKILRFKCEELLIKPDIKNSQKCTPYVEPMKSGTFIKLYEYDMKSCGDKKLSMPSGLTDALNMMIAVTTIPVRLVECRKSTGRTNQATVRGYEARLSSMGKVEENIEDKFPLTSTLKVDGQDLEIKIYAFKEGKEKNYKKANSSIVFTLNGQTQGFLSDSLFAKKSIGLEYIKKSIFVIVDCTNIDISLLEELFMNSRDRLRDSRFADKIKSELEDTIKNTYALEELMNERRKKDLELKTEDNKILLDDLKGFIKDNPDIKNILNSGIDILGNSSIEEGSTKQDRDDRNDFEGKEYPTYFELKSREIKGKLERSLGKKFMIKIETDVKNGFLDREIDKAKLIIKKEGEEVKDFKAILDRGIIDVSIGVDELTRVGDLQKYSFEIKTFKGESFTNKFEVLFKEKRKYPDPKPKKITNETKLTLPNIIYVKEEELESKEMKRDSALKIIRGKENVFLINIDNIHIRNTIKNEKDLVLKEKMLNQYKFSMVLYGMSILSDFENESDCESQDDFHKIVETSSKSFAKMFFPIQNINKKLSI